MPRSPLALSAGLLIAGLAAAGCASSASASLPAWRAVSLGTLCERLPAWMPESASDIAANEALAANLTAVVPRVDAPQRQVVDAFAQAQSAYAQALANQPDVFAVRLRALARAQEDIARACEEAGKPLQP